MPEHVAEALILVHRIVGYPLALVVAPLALATFAGARGHRWSGMSYAVLMTFLYLSGTVLTLTQHDWLTWNFGRNVTFNLLGYSLLLYGLRAMWLLNHPGAPRPTRLDRGLTVLLIATVAAMTLLAVDRNTPLRIFSLAGIALVVTELREWRAGMSPALLYRRHLRYMMASYFYVLTVVSVVHMRDEIRSDLRWLWPLLIAVPAIWLVTGPERLRVRRAAASRLAIIATLVVALGFGAYVATDVARELREARPTDPGRQPSMSR